MRRTKVVSTKPSIFTKVQLFAQVFEVGNERQGTERIEGKRMTGMEMEWPHYRILFSVASVTLAFVCLAAATAVRGSTVAKQIFSAVAILLYLAQIMVWSLSGPGARARSGTGLWLVILLVSFLVGFVWLRGLFKERR